MLKELHIKNYALVDSLSVSFNSGLTTMTGETGAGKSIIIGALSLVLGDKGNTSVVRSGASEASVDAVLDIRGRSELTPWFEARGITIGDDDLIIRRVIKAEGRGSSYVQGVPVPRTDIADLTAGLFDLHGQHQHQTLFNKENHRRVLDNFGALGSRVDQFSDSFNSLQELRKELLTLQELEKQAVGEAEEMQRSIAEIQDADLDPQELEVLEHERKLMSQSERLGDFLSTAIDSGEILSVLQAQKDAVMRASGIDSELSKLADRFDSSIIEYQDIQESLKDYRRNMNFSPQRLEEVEGRLALIRRLQKKYGPGIEDVLKYCENSKETLYKLENREGEIKKLSEKIANQESVVAQEAQAISIQRKKTALDLQSRIQDILRPLGMGNALFKISVTNRENPSGGLSCGPKGIDVIEFLMSANKGEQLKPLRSIASGGELSRVMLAIKTILAESDNVSTLVFDEIDTGIGGEVALAVGEHLSKLAEFAQVLCITHLASIAARGKTHLQVRKEVADNRTITRLVELDNEERVSEIARMLSGDSQNVASLGHARELVNQLKG